MAFSGPALIFTITYDDGSNKVSLGAQLQPSAIVWDSITPSTDVWSIADGTLENPDGTNAGFGFDTSKLPTLFPVARSAVVGTDTHGTLGFDIDNAGLTASERDKILGLFLSGGRAKLQAIVDGVSGNELVVELRSLQTADFLLNAGTLEPAYHAGSPSSNLTVPSGDAIGNYSVTLADDFTSPTYSATAATVTASNLTLSASDTAPPDSASRNLEMKIAHSGYGKESILPVDIHVPTDLIVLLDRSGSMGAINPATSASKWDAAVQVANLFTQLYGTMLPNLSAPSGSIADQNKVGIGRFRWTGGAAEIPITSPLVAATTTPSVPAGGPGGGTPIGQALKEAAAAFMPNRWRQRQIVLLTDGMDNAGMPALTALSGTSDFPSADPSAGNYDADKGVTLHNVSYALTGETSVVDLETLAANHGGQYHNSAPDSDPLSSDGLRAMFLSALSSILPVERAEAASPTDVPVEDGVERVLFVATREFSSSTDKLQLSNGANSTDNANAAQGNGYSWVSVDNPAPGTWTIDNSPAGSSVFAIYDLSLRTRFGAERSGLGQPVKLWATVHHQGHPVSGADIRAALSAPGQSQGELLSKFATQGGLGRALRRGTLKPRPLSIALGRPLSPLAPISVVSAQPTHNLAASRLADVHSVQRQLLNAAEAEDHLKFQYRRRSISLREVHPGYYETTLPASEAPHEGVYNAEFRATGTTPRGFRFARDHRLSFLLDSVPELEHSHSTLVQANLADGRPVWVGTVQPRNALRKPLGPGLGHKLAFDYLDARDRKNPKLPKLPTVDNLDGTYSTALSLAIDRLPKFGLFYGDPDRDAPAIVVRERSRDTKQVRVRIDKIQVLNDHDPCLKGAGELVFVATIAPNASPSRRVNRQLPEHKHYTANSGETIEVGEVVYEGLVEADSSLAISLSGKELDWPSCFDRHDELTRYVRTIPLPKTTTHYAPDDEPADPETLRDWKLWYTVEVE